MALVSLKKQLEAPRLIRRPATARRKPQQPGPRPARRQAEPEAPPADGNGRYELKRNLLLSLKPGDLDRARSVALNLQVEDGQREVVHQLRDFRLALAPRKAGDDVLLRLLIALNSEE